MFAHKHLIIYNASNAMIHYIHQSIKKSLCICGCGLNLSCILQVPKNIFKRWTSWWIRWYAFVGYGDYDWQRLLRTRRKYCGVHDLLSSFLALKTRLRKTQSRIEIRICFLYCKYEGYINFEGCIRSRLYRILKVFLKSIDCSKSKDS